MYYVLHSAQYSERDILLIKPCLESVRVQLSVSYLTSRTTELIQYNDFYPELACLMHHGMLKYFLSHYLFLFST